MNVAFMAGSSKHGKALRASEGWKSVVASRLLVNASNSQL